MGKKVSENQMFQKMLTWVRMAIQRLFGQPSTDLAISPTMQSLIDQWAAAYQQHSSISCPSLGIAAGISAEFARLVVLEAQINLTGTRGQWMDSQLVTFRRNLRKNVEYACALGGMVFKPYVVGNSFAIDCVQADSFFPTAFDSSGRLTGAVFAQQLTRDGKIYTRLESHNFIAGKETIQNKAFCSGSNVALGSEIPLTAVAEWADIAPEITISNLQQPLFAYFQIPLANNKDRSSPLGVSVFSNGLELMTQADKQFARLLWEYEGGQLAIDVDETAIRHNEDGSAQLDQTQQRLYRRNLNTRDGSLYEAFTPSLRDSSYLAGLDSILKRIEFACNLSYGTLSDPQSTEKTATEVKMAKQRSYAAVCDIQTALQSALDGLFYAMDTLAQLYQIGEGIPGDWQASYQWQDSILTDEQTARQSDREDALSGFIPKWRYNVQWLGMDEQQAKAAVQEASGQIPDPFGLE